jgi:glutathione S-transferase
MCRKESVVMRLHHSPASPFGRKVLVCAHEKAIAGRITVVPTSPALDPGLRALNPLAQIPTLVIDEGDALFDSTVICHYLELIAPDPPLYPTPPAALVAALRRQALGDAICDAAVLRRMESQRPAGERSAAQDARLAGRVGHALAWLEARPDELDGPPDIGRIAIACALGYLDLRFAHEPWRARHPNLARWFEAFDLRPSMRATAAAP